MEFLQKLFLVNLSATFRRFPLPLLLSVCFVLQSIVMIHAGSYEILWVIMPSLAGCFFASVSLSLWGEVEGWKPERAVGLTLIACGVIFGLRMVEAPREEYLAFLLPGLLLLLAALPHSLQRTTPEQGEGECCHYNTDLLVHSFFASLAGVVLGGGVSATLASLDYLFGVPINRDLYADIWALSLGGFAPLYALANLASPKYSNVAEAPPYPRGFQFIVQYILAPLVIVYAAILYAYLARMALTWTLPRGHLAAMICGFSAVGTLTYLFSYPLAQEGKKLPQLIRRYFYPALLVPALMLALAIGVRIQHYGVTPERYALLLGLAWLLFSSLYMSFWKNASVKYVLLALGLLLVLGAAGPWGTNSVSLASQKSRLVAALEEAGHLKDGKVIKLTTPVSFEHRKRISGGIEYFYEKNHSPALEELFPGISAKTCNGACSYEFRLEEVSPYYLGWDYVDRWQFDDAQSIGPGREFYYSPLESEISAQRVIASVAGYDYLVNVDLFNDGTQEVALSPVRKVTVSLRSNHLNVAQGKETLSFDLNPLISKLRKKGANKAPRAEFVFTQHPVALQLESLEGYEENKKLVVQRLNLTLLIKNTPTTGH